MTFLDMFIEAIRLINVPANHLLSSEFIKFFGVNAYDFHTNHNYALVRADHHNESKEVPLYLILWIVLDGISAFRTFVPRTLLKRKRLKFLNY